MKSGPGFVRIHLLTLFVAMLIVSGMLGMNLQRREQVFYSFHSDSSIAGPVNVLVKLHERSYYGWPLTLSVTEKITCYIVPFPASEAKNIPMNSLVISDTINPRHLAEVAPKTYQDIQNATAIDRATTDHVLYSSVLYQYLVALILLIAVMALLEYHIRRASNSAQDPEPLPEA